MAVFPAWEKSGCNALSKSRGDSMKTWMQKISLLALVVAAWVLNQSSIQTARADAFGSAGLMVTPDKGYATLLSNGIVVFFGSYANESEIFDPVTGTWKTTGFAAESHVNSKLTSLANGEALIEGGMGQQLIAT